jgi:hypothetical protein
MHGVQRYRVAEVEAQFAVMAQQETKQAANQQPEAEADTLPPPQQHGEGRLLPPAQVDHHLPNCDQDNTIQAEKLRALVKSTEELAAELRQAQQDAAQVASHTLTAAVTQPPLPNILGCWSDVCIG